MKYHKIPTIFKRDDETKKVIEGQFTLPQIEFLKDNKWVFTEKIDGTNIRVIWNGITVEFRGRTDNAQIPASLFKRLQELFLTPEKIELFKEIFGDGDVIMEEKRPLEAPVMLCGEGYGMKIQKGGGKYIPDGVDFILFDVHIGMWLERTNVEDIANKLGIGVVPIVGRGDLSDAIAIIKVRGLKSQWGDFEAEGIVARPAVELQDRRGDRMITKIKGHDFETRGRF